MGEGGEEEKNLTLVSLLAIVILTLYTVASPIFEKYHFHYMHESGLCMIIGVIITSLVMLSNPKTNFTQTLNFNDEIFFTFILPPIIFSAGYNLRRTTFFKYFMYIATFGVIGTVTSFLVVSPLTYIANKNDLFYLSFSANQQDNNTPIFNDTYINSHINALYSDSQPSISSYLNETEESSEDPEEEKHNIQQKELIKFTVPEILLFASVISATDTIAALTFISEENEPKLFSILFGEGVLNDAVCIVLYRILADFTSRGEEFTTKTPIIMLNEFLSLFFFSFLIGAIVGCFCAYLLKYFKKNNIILNRMQEISVLIFCAFFSYCLTEELGLSPIISMLFCGLFMSNYAFYNLSFQAREESSVVSRMLSNFAEAFVFTYLGLTLVYYMTHCLSLSFILIELFIVIFGRIVAIFGLSWVMKVCGVNSFKLKTSQKGIMSCAGSIRGAIAFGLAISIDSNNKKNKEVLISSTLILVFFTTIVFGALMPFMINIMKKLDPVETNQIVSLEQHQDEIISSSDNIQSSVFNFVHPNFIDKYEGSKEKNFEVLKNRISYWLGHYWFEFDEMYIKPRLCYLWPYVRDDNMNLKTVILSACNKYEEEQSKIDKENYGKDRAYYESYSSSHNVENTPNTLNDHNISHNNEYKPPLLNKKNEDKKTVGNSNMNQGMFEMNDLKKGY